MKRPLITLDIDGPFRLRKLPRFLKVFFLKRLFRKRLRRNINRLQRVIRALDYLGIEIIRAEVRASGSKGLHIYLRLSREIDRKDPVVRAVRGALGDDQGRIARDLVRMAMGMKIGMLMFQRKRGKQERPLHRESQQLTKAIRLLKAGKKPREVVRDVLSSRLSQPTEDEVQEDPKGPELRPKAPGKL